MAERLATNLPAKMDLAKLFVLQMEFSMHFYQII